MRRILLAFAVAIVTLWGCNDSPTDEVVVTDVVVSPATLTLNAGQSQRLEAKILPQDATAQIAWSSSNESVAIVNSNGVVKGIKSGKATIIASAGKVSGACSVEVVNKATSIELSEESLHFSAVEQERELMATVFPENADNVSIKWSTSDPSVVSVKGSITNKFIGIVTSVGIGEATITATCGDPEATCSVTVSIDTASIQITPTKLTFDTLGDTSQLKVKANPEGAVIDEDNVVWRSENDDIATVTDSGLVTSVGNGETVITATYGDLETTCHVTVAVVATRIELSHETLAFLDLNQSVQLTATVYPSETFDKTITWESSNRGVVEVSDTGLVTSIGDGEAEITARCGNVTATCCVLVGDAIVQISPSKLSFSSLGAQKQLSLNVYIEDDTFDPNSVVWRSSNEGVVTVTDSGLATSIGNGEATITAEYKELKATCRVTVAVAATSIELSQTVLTFISYQTSAQLTANVYPSETADKSITWKSSDTSVANVSDTGLVTAVGNGEAIITATCGNVHATCNVKVVKTTLQLSPSNLSFSTLGAQEQLTLNVYPANAPVDLSGVEWHSSNDSVATVSSSGLVTSRDNGTATITATYNELSATCSVDVFVKVSRIELSHNSIKFTSAGESVQLTANIQPSEVADLSIAWKSLDPSVANVSDTGLVTAVSNGKTIITATCGGVQALCHVFVSIRTVEIEGDRATCLLSGVDSIELAQIIEEIHAAGVKKISIYGDYNAIDLSRLDLLNNVGIVFEELDLSGVINWPIVDGVPTLPDRAFRSVELFEHIILPDEIRVIGEYAFSQCGDYFKKITARGVTTIDRYAFYLCYLLEEVDMPNVTTISTEAFSDCASLAEVNMTNVQTIGQKAFYRCSALAEVNMPEATSIGDQAFYQSGITKAYFPKVESLNTAVFSWSRSLKEVDMPSCTTIGSTTPSGTRWVGPFNGCTALNKVNMPSLTFVGDYSFTGCSSLTSIELPEVVELGCNVFGDCTMLTDVVLPKARLIMYYPFNGCRNLTNLVLTTSDSLEFLWNYEYVNGEWIIWDNVRVVYGGLDNTNLTIHSRWANEVTYDVMGKPVWRYETWKSITFVD